MKTLIKRLYTTKNLAKDQWIYLFDHQNDNTDVYLYQLAREVTHETYGNQIFIRGLIEFTNYCKNDCYYCGIRRSNPHVKRYRLTKAEILQCCETAYRFGYRTFVLQGGEDPYFTDSRMVSILSLIRSNYPDCAITLSIGERSYESYKACFDAGAVRFLLRHETYCDSHYKKLHPPSMSGAGRKECLYHLKEIGYQIGTGFMVGSPFQTSENLALDMMFIKSLNPQMVGIGPYITSKETPFKHQPCGTLKQTLYILSLLRLMIPTLLLPATTALGAMDKQGRILGIESGANVLMQNITPAHKRGHYTLYENKARAGDIDIGPNNPLFRELEQKGYQIAQTRGDSLNKKEVSYHV